MDTRRLPKSIEIDGVDIEIYSDYRDILDIFVILNDPDLLERERIAIALEYFYTDVDKITDGNKAILEMFNFITMSDDTEIQGSDSSPSKPLYDWEQDFKIIIAPINKVLGFDARGAEYVHWWTFLSAFMEIGECTFSTYVGIRDKLNKGKKLEKYEEKIYHDNKEQIVLKKKYDKTTQSILDEIMGKGV